MNQHFPLSVGFSSCPNDTFMFHGWVHGLVEGPAIAPVIEDVETLNARVIAADLGRRLPVSKLSVGVLPDCLAEYCVLQVGAALGRGCGPLVVCRPEAGMAPGLGDLVGLPVAVPGLHTTAWRLLQAFAPAVRPVPMGFEQVMGAVVRGEVAAGLVIHEGRFTYAQAGLTALADLGELWERETGLPVPLGVIAAQRALGPEVHRHLQQALRRSLDQAWAEPQLGAAWVRSHAQALDAEVIAQHIGLYVNDYSRGLGPQGREAITTLVTRCGGDGNALCWGPE